MTSSLIKKIKNSPKPLAVLADAFNKNPAAVSKTARSTPSGMEINRVKKSSNPLALLADGVKSVYDWRVKKQEDWKKKRKAGTTYASIWD